MLNIVFFRIAHNRFEVFLNAMPVFFFFGQSMAAQGLFMRKNRRPAASVQGMGRGGETKRRQ
jgi:uncharacterized membrane protein